MNRTLKKFGLRRASRAFELDRRSHRRLPRERRRALTCKIAARSEAPCALTRKKAKALDGYDWSAVSWPEGFGRADLEALSFVGPCEDLVLMGDVGTAGGTGAPGSGAGRTSGSARAARGSSR